jgi:hypothetical protein
LKFLGEEGLKTLAAVINAIDDIKADKNELDKYLKIEDYIPGSGAGLLVRNK